MRMCAGRGSFASVGEFGEAAVIQSQCISSGNPGRRGSIVTATAPKHTSRIQTTHDRKQRRRCAFPAYTKANACLLDSQPFIILILPVPRRPVCRRLSAIHSGLSPCLETRYGYRGVNDIGGRSIDALLSSAPVSSSLSSLTNTTRESDSSSDVTRQEGPSTCAPSDPSCLPAGRVLDTYLPNRGTLLPARLPVCIVHPSPLPVRFTIPSRLV
ncbi:hypothetical protein B0T11DRAFT_56557 [Plectosphaerella cucumerina]|uniref:Uncharacterized protein n=1 Tax=Plectosphaerella cucumerina TaxID=40658 RepID=A0A8K0TJ21_9PEZI|nr:hypothetical protein B0T11DRAFT_56557 [Plectosphaerella cucumerina]